MKQKLCFGLSLCLAAALLFSGCGSSSATAVYVQSVEALSSMGALTPSDRFGGLVVCEHVAQITKDENKAVKELLVQEGQDVTAGQPLFTYDTDQLELELGRKQLELEQLKATIENYRQQLAELEGERNRASSGEQLAYTIQIQTVQLDLKEAELNLGAKQTETDQAAALLENAAVTAPVDGRIQAINENGYDNYGNPLPYITIQQTGAYRVKGTIGELQRFALTEGMQVKIHSRTDETAVWYGTVTLVDFENPSQGSQQDLYYGMPADEMTTSSRYPFYVELHSTQGLLLGQHVYIQPDVEEVGEGQLTLSSGFFCYEEDGSVYVWAEDRGKLTKRPVTLGAYDGNTDSFCIESGLALTDFIAFPDPQLCAEGVPTTHAEAAAAGSEVAP